MTINKFFENDLNVSETSRQLFVHRNTLVYRLEKIYKLTGLDLRKFDQAIVFKVAMMVHKDNLESNSIGKSDNDFWGVLLKPHPIIVFCFLRSNEICLIRKK